MSVWRMEIDMSFATENEMKAMMNLIQSMRNKLMKQEGQLPIPCSVTYHQCMHDEGAPCGGYKNVEFDGVTDYGVPAEDILPESIKTRVKANLQTELDTVKTELNVLKKKENNTTISNFDTNV